MTKRTDIKMTAEGNGLVSLTNMSGNPVFYFLQELRKTGFTRSALVGLPHPVSSIKMGQLVEFLARADKAGLTAAFGTAPNFKAEG